MKQLAGLGMLAVMTAIAGCSTPPAPQPFGQAYSRHVALMPYTAQGVTVAGTTTWYYGRTNGLSAWPVEGGIVYIGTQQDSQHKAGATSKNGGGDFSSAEKSAGNGAKDASATQGSEHNNTLEINGITVLKSPLLVVHYPLDVADQLYDKSANKLAKWIKIEKESQMLNGEKLLVVGFTDDIGLDDANMPLSSERATWLAAQIKAAGIKADIKTIGSGSSPQIVDNRIKHGRKMNRRAAIYLVKEPS